MKKNIIYTCPMHPEIKSENPGSCPKCGMTLVPELPAEDDETALANHNMAKKFWIALALSY
jgi:Cu+-exporting ATPase